MTRDRELRDRLENLQARRKDLAEDVDPQLLQREFELSVADLGREREHLLAEQHRFQKLLAEAEQAHQRALADASANASPAKARGALYGGLVGGLLVVAAIWFVLASGPQVRQGFLALALALTAWAAAAQRPGRE